MAELGFELPKSQHGSYRFSVLLLPGTRCMTVEKWPHLSGPQFAPCKVGQQFQLGVDPPGP